ncbi:MAG: 4-(cytidine 5'-diphospho)-2-C-methyl-D-erythritol kinase [archaeon]|nr:4-(cytidine 5'-diphospho)-2-C-methyl-D-erythritol kinase [archaeon]
MLKSFAKVNLVLDLVRKREDGYHDVEFVMQEISLFDEIRIKKSNELKISCNDVSVPVNEKNSCYKAVRLLQEASGIEENVAIELNKTIPSAGGLGGGTSNAAAVLSYLNKEWKLNYSNEKLSLIAKNVGADVAFFLYGKTALCKGIGEIVTPLKNLPKMQVLVITPEIAVPEQKTKWIYSKVKVNELKHPSCAQMIKAIESENKQQIALLTGNVFEQLELKEYEKVFSLIKDLKTHSLNALMAGAGPSVFALFDSKNEAKNAFNYYKKEFDSIFLCETI